MVKYTSMMHLMKTPFIIIELWTFIVKTQPPDGQTPSKMGRYFMPIICFDLYYTGSPTESSRMCKIELQYIINWTQERSFVFKTLDTLQFYVTFPWWSYSINPIQLITNRWPNKRCTIYIVLSLVKHPTANKYNNVSYNFQFFMEL